MVSAAGVAPAIPRSQAECPAATGLRAVGPCALTTPGAGEMKDTNPDNGPAVRLEIGGPEGSCTLIFPADNGALCWLSYGSGMACRAEARIGWHARPPLRSGRRLVGGAGNAPVRRFRHIFCDARFTVEQPEHLPRLVAGVGVAPTEAELMR